VKVGLIGLGKQGKPLARNVLAAGHELVVYDTRRETVDELAALGAGAGSSPRDVAARSEVILICVRDDEQLRAAMHGADGVLAELSAGSVVAIHSTVSPELVAQLAPDVEAKGADLLDAPVSGGERGAVARTMTFLVGGGEASFARCRPLFEASGQKITHAGGLGAGIRAKRVHQVILVGNRPAAYEGMRLGLVSGLSKEILQKIVHDGAAQSYVADNWFTRSSGPHAPPVYFKDLQLCVAFAREMGVAIPAAALGQQFIDDIVP
jgi:3-hydroxyisobutyrate dehydrogenase-like beta-hydroxyacid dehydrogenase